MAAMSAAHDRSAVIIMVRRGKRSAAAPASSPKSRYGNASRPVTAAVSPAEPLAWYASIGSATALAAVPATETERARNHRRNWASASNRSWAGTAGMGTG